MNFAYILEQIIVKINTDKSMYGLFIGELVEDFVVFWAR